MSSSSSPQQSSLFFFGRSNEHITLYLDLSSSFFDINNTSLNTSFNHKIF
ncbi:MAG: hypothetical protein Edafosvirus12_33 [Edafosvirus sp.]|uniref:Uncharacterized protein n=1 Tax=Edafosvirus sp. TaxID=2487765 RepID=A0A3G4ZVR3_9VIRU|nr:MAG: hypothetical protein Edafosvirus12_33 [Edafosvirus sp.]